LHTANSLWGQRGMTWQRPFIEALGRNFGAGMRLVDYLTQAEAARQAINGWTAAQTQDRIPQIVPPDIIDTDTRLVLVNAIYFKAPWLAPFEPTATSDQPFRRGDGTTVATPTMSGELFNAEVAGGAGWRGVRLPYLGERLAMAVVVPDDLAAFERSLDGAGLARMLGAFHPAPRLLHLQLPRWRFRQQTGLAEHLAALGMPTAFDPARADFSGMTEQDTLFISAVLHEAFIAVDEQGTEAAAATAVIMATSMSSETVSFIIDRPFLFVIHDVETATPLFIGRVDDPTSTSD
jgi:serpin B